MSWDQFAQSMLTIVFLSFVAERFLSVVFETEQFIQRASGRKGIKPTIAIVLSVLIALALNVSLIDIMRSAEDGYEPGGYEWTRAAGTDIGTYLLSLAKNLALLLVTALAIAGGSKASLKLFRDVWGIRSSSESDRLESREGAKRSSQSLEAAKGNETAAKNLESKLDIWSKQNLQSR